MKGILFFISIAMLWGGGQGVYVGLTNLEPTEISCSEFAKGETSKKWLIVKGCYIDNHDVTVLYGGSTATKNSDYYLSIRESESSEVFSYLKVNSENHRTVYANILNLQDDEEKYADFLDKNPKQLEFLSTAGYRDIQGLQLFGIEDISEEDRKLFKEDVANENFAVIDENEKPSMGFSLAVSILGIIIIAGVIMAWKR